MKTKHLVRKIKSLLSADKRKQLKKFESLEKILKRLKKKQSALQAKLRKEEDKQRRKEIERKLKVIMVQRRKGLDLRDKLAKRRREDD